MNEVLKANVMIRCQGRINVRDNAVERGFIDMLSSKMLGKLTYKTNHGLHDVIDLFDSRSNIMVNVTK